MTNHSSDRCRRFALALLVAAASAAAGCGTPSGAEPSVAAQDDAAGGEGRAAGPSAAPLRVRVERARRRVLATDSAVPAVVSAFQRAELAAEVSGRVVARLVEAGDRVGEGDPLIRIDDTRLKLAAKEARHGLDLAVAESSEALRQLKRAQQLRKEKLISESELDERQTAFERARANRSRAEVVLAQADRAVADATVRAPFAGIVESVDVDVGEYLQPGAPVAMVVDFSRARIFAGVTAAEAARLSAGMRVEVSFDDLGGAVIEATLRSVGRVADRDGTYRAELWLESPDPRLRDGMVGEVRFSGSGAAPVITVGRSALVRRDGKMMVFVVTDEEGKSIVRARRVETGRSDAAHIAIVGGLDEGELVVVDGLFALGDGSAVAVESRPE